jgi:hypothetical protein
VRKNSAPRTAPLMTSRLRSFFMDYWQRTTIPKRYNALELNTTGQAAEKNS